MANKKLKDIPFSVLDLVPITAGSTIGAALKNSRQLAQHAEQLGYRRYWLAEHHNTESVASSATAVLIGHIAEATSTMRVGSGGIMLPNHAPLMVAEQFGTLAALYPGRIDLGLGRAPGTDQLTAKALRRNNLNSTLSFPEDVRALQTYFSVNNKNALVRAIPGEGMDVPIWILGSSTDSAVLAASFGLPYAFASHFAPAQLGMALDIYRNRFRPSPYLEKPYVMTGVNIIAGETTEEAKKLASSYYQLVVDLIAGRRRPLQPPVDNIDEIWTDYEKTSVQHMAQYSYTGDIPTIKSGLSHFQEQFEPDELMVVSHIYDPAARRRSYELLMQLKNG